MDLQDLPDYLRRLKDELPRQLAEERRDKMQTVLDAVLRESADKDVKEVKALIEQQWRAELGSDLDEPKLSEYAADLAAGRRIKLNVTVRS
jgi:hypothetical protein